MDKTPLELLTTLLKKNNIKLSNGYKLALMNKFCNNRFSEMAFYNEKAIVSKSEMEQLVAAIKLLKNNYPIQYILQFADFCEMELFVDERVLIPRPETEEIVTSLISLIKQNKNKKKYVIADIGCGSLAIGLALYLGLKNHHFDCELHAIDICQDALEVAKINATKYHVPVKFYQGDLLTPLIENNIKPDILVANLPYIKNDYPLDKNVLFEPKKALFGGEDGLVLIKKCLEQIHNIFKENMIISLEFGYDQAEEILKLAQNVYPSNRWQLKKDMYGQNRQLIFY